MENMTIERIYEILLSDERRIDKTIKDLLAVRYEVRDKNISYTPFNKAVLKLKAALEELAIVKQEVENQKVLEDIIKMKEKQDE